MPCALHLQLPDTRGCNEFACWSAGRAAELHGAVHRCGLPGRIPGTAPRRRGVHILLAPLRHAGEGQGLAAGLLPGDCVVIAHDDLQASEHFAPHSSSCLCKAQGAGSLASTCQHSIAHILRNGCRCSIVAWSLCCTEVLRCALCSRTILCAAVQVSDDLHTEVHDCYHLPHIMGR
jgi:hypothetical protein